MIHILNGSVGYRLDHNGRRVASSGDTRPSHTLVDAGDGADLLLDETFPSPGVFAQKASVPLAFAERVVNGVHTSPAAGGGVFARVAARMSAMFHVVVEHDTVGPAFAEIRAMYEGPVTIAPDLTTFTITRDAAVSGRTVIDPFA